MNNNLKKLPELWQNLIKRYSFMAFIMLPLAEFIITSISWLLLHFDAKILYLLQAPFFTINISTVVILYKKEEQTLKYIENDFLSSNKWYNFILFVFAIIALYIHFITILCTILLCLYIPIKLDNTFNTQIYSAMHFERLPKPISEIFLYFIFICRFLYGHTAYFIAFLIYNILKTSFQLIVVPVIYLLNYLWVSLIKIILFVGRLIYAIIITIFMICSETT